MLAKEVRMKLLIAFCAEEQGAVISAEFVLLATILCVGLVVGIQSLRTSIAFEIADTAAAISTLNQSYTFGGGTMHETRITGSIFTDTFGSDIPNDFCDDGQAQTNVCLGVGGASAETP